MKPGRGDAMISIEDQLAQERVAEVIVADLPGVSPELAEEDRAPEKSKDGNWWEGGWRSEQEGGHGTREDEGGKDTERPSTSSSGDGKGPQQIGPTSWLGMWTSRIVGSLSPFQTPNGPEGVRSTLSLPSPTRSQDELEWQEEDNDGKQSHIQLSSTDGESYGGQEVPNLSEKEDVPGLEGEATATDHMRSLGQVTTSLSTLSLQNAGWGTRSIIVPSSPEYTPSTGTSASSPSSPLFKKHDMHGDASREGWRLLDRGKNGKTRDLQRQPWRPPQEFGWASLSALSDSARAGPSARAGHTLLPLGTRLVAIGGAAHSNQCFNDVWELDTQTQCWWQRRCVGDVPPPTAYNSSTAVWPVFFGKGGSGTPRVIIFGGWQAEVCSNDTYVLQGFQGPPDSPLIWRRLVHKKSPSHTPPTASGRSPSQMRVPPPRSMHTGAFVAGRLVIYGGWAADPTSTDPEAPNKKSRRGLGVFLGDTWMLDLSTLTWEEMEADGPHLGLRHRFGTTRKAESAGLTGASGEAPAGMRGRTGGKLQSGPAGSARSSSRAFLPCRPLKVEGAVESMDKVVLVDAGAEKLEVEYVGDEGRTGSGKGYGAHVACGGRTDVEREEEREGGRLLQPSPRGGHAAIVLPHGRMLVFGGHSLSGSLNDMWVLDVHAGAWSEVVQRGDVPTPRSGHSLIAMPGLQGHQALLFGGFNGRRALNDLFLLNTCTMTWVRVQPTLGASTPTSRSGHAAAMVGSRLFISGGCNPHLGFLRDVHALDTEHPQLAAVELSSAPPSRPLTQNPITAHVDFFDGQPPSTPLAFQWFRSKSGLPFSPIAGSGGPTYGPTIDDVNCRVLVSCMPCDPFEGRPLGPSYICCTHQEVKIDPRIERIVKGHMLIGTATFPVSLPPAYYQPRGNSNNGLTKAPQVPAQAIADSEITGTNGKESSAPQHVNKDQKEEEATGVTRRASARTALLLVLEKHSWILRRFDNSERLLGGALGQEFQVGLVPGAGKSIVLQMHEGGMMTLEARSGEERDVVVLCSRAFWAMSIRELALAGAMELRISKHDQSQDSD